MLRSRPIIGLVPILLCATIARGQPAAAPDFTTRIRPLLTTHCLDCHGPDASRREADLRLDDLTAALTARDGKPPIIRPGDSGASELMRRLTADDPLQRMPPAESQRHLTEQQIELFRAWIDAGAKWQPHWAYTRPLRPALPTVRRVDWPRNAIDYFALASMEQRGLEPQAEATRALLLRRLFFDLIGLPPTPEEVLAFEKDPRPDAYERWVDRLLASPRYGERMATPWLDLARYADTHGLHADSHRDMWLWRDWVVGALNRNLPFDQFTVQQLAGDLLPQASLDQRLATGFHRNTLLNSEEGAIAEEFLAEYVVDRVNTTGSVWLAQTLECARCHDHKFDPITQHDYYRMFAFYNTIDEPGLGGRQGNAAPVLSIPTAHQRREQAELQRRIAALDESQRQRREEIETTRSIWQRELAATRNVAAPADSALHLPFDEQEGTQVHDQRGNSLGAASGEPQWLSAGRFAGALLMDGHTAVDIAPAEPVASPAGFSVSLWLFPTTQDRMTIAACRVGLGSLRGWQWELHDGRPTVRVMFEGRPTPLAVRTADPLPLRRWQHLVLAYETAAGDDGIRMFLDGQAVAVELAESSDREIQVAGQPLRFGGLDGAGFRGILDDVRLFARPLTAADAGLLAGADPIGELLAIPDAQRTAAQNATLDEYYLQQIDAVYRPAQRQLGELRRALQQLEASIPTAMVMEEMRRPRPTHVLLRGDYRRLGEAVQPGVPAVLGPQDADRSANRLGLAHWLVDPRHPLTARVAVNRYWQLFFGQGLVRTSDDFGVRGELPSHPQLLDWLAVEFVASGWDVKHVQRLLVTSATYRQSSTATASQIAADPDNRWLSRGPRQRLPAEMIRDSALYAAGLLHAPLGGPPVFPYQPPGLWEQLAYNADEYSAQRYVASRGADLYRRSLYTFWKRTSPPPSMSLFDAPSRERCTAQRTRSNTALQALLLMNDPTYMDAARGVAQRVLREGGADTESRLHRAFRLVLSRAPQPHETELLRRTVEVLSSHFAAQPEAADALAGGFEWQGNTQQAPAERAVWTALAGILLNLDETISKP
jgi:hypothetical protein